MKRLFDITLAVLLLLLTWPVILVIALAILRRDGAPVFYVAERMKTPEQPFNLIKFRTMSNTPEDANAGVTGGDKANRITPIGRTLRRFRLDELPQLINVLRGDMSFVGPRPPLRQYTEAFPELYGRVLRSRPGVTGLATLHYHRHEERLIASATTPQETEAIYVRRCVPRKAALDLIYQRHASVCFDIRILWQTLAKVAGK
ncbi:sugar transferase [Thalassorhabdomicrobium marinisediminis]|uniref:Sugar transferase n=1 Tax=Thalassorhabdomicrobium marinisediminis TaxID=2170577 RepID=A0A2T7G068_9RHOB|nr:sugar transferase [Thalassorhabdomicrobium marinisediminis]PVA07811.1 sugar transferase [Thalassorhabdomicrobium marinisediminis]